MNYRESSTAERCKRVGCTRKRRGHNLNRDTCGAVCGYIYRLHSEGQAICAQLGHSDPVDEYLIATKEIGKALDRAQKARAVLRRLSAQAGWTDQQWDNLLNSAHTGQGTGTGTPGVQQVEAGQHAG